jgi:RsiW-degrading membrane proteinase PrsW (M82 family)
LGNTKPYRIKGGDCIGALVQAASAPILIGAIYIYIRDKYEKEPYAMLVSGLMYGIYSTLVIWSVGIFLEKLFPHEETPFFSAFVSSAGIEEGVKFLFLYFLVWRNPNFNEPFDGIVYGVFVALGFALLENIIYVLHDNLGGYSTALARAVFSVPAHGLFGVEMGYYLAAAKFERKKKYLFFAFFIPYLLHAVYNYILFLDKKLLWVPFLGFVLFLWFLGLKRMRLLLECSPFKR